MERKGTWSLTFSPPKLLQFMGAGHDTATITLTFSFYVMITQPSTQERLRAEILDLVNRTPGGEPSFSAIDELQYLNMFVKEVLRVYPPREFSCARSLRCLISSGRLMFTS